MFPQLAGPCQVDGLGLPAAPCFSLAPCSRNAGANPFRNQAALEFGNCGNDRHQELAGRVGAVGVDRLVRAHETHAILVQPAHGSDEFVNAPKDPVEPDNHNNIEPAPVRIG